MRKQDHNTNDEMKEQWNEINIQNNETWVIPYWINDTL